MFHVSSATWRSTSKLIGIKQAAFILITNLQSGLALAHHPWGHRESDTTERLKNSSSYLFWFSTGIAQRLGLNYFESTLTSWKIGKRKIWPESWVSYLHVISSYDTSSTLASGQLDFFLVSLGFSGHISSESSPGLITLLFLINLYFRS